MKKIFFITFLNKKQETLLPVLYTKIHGPLIFLTHFCVELAGKKILYKCVMSKASSQKKKFKGSKEKEYFYWSLFFAGLYPYGPSFLSLWGVKIFYRPSFFYSSLFASSLSLIPTFFGGSFAPWHIAHEKMALQFLAMTNKTSQLFHGPLIIFFDRNPQKNIVGRHFYLEGLEKVLELFFQQAISLDKKIIPFFLSLFLSSPKGTYSWFSKLFSLKNFLMGDDQLENLETWYQSSLFISQINCLIIAPRRLTDEEIENKVSSLSLAHVCLLKDEGLRDVSSSLIRQNTVKKGLL